MSNEEFVRSARVGDEEDEWLRLLLGEHARLTGSPHAKRLLRSAISLPLMRIEPIRLPCALEETWAPFLSRFGGLEPATRKVVATPQPEAVRAAQQSAV
jgi:hypothetical protein